MKSKQILFLHIIYWGLYLIKESISFIYFDKSHVILTITFFLTSVACFYFNYFWVVPKFFDVKKLYKIIIGYFLSVFFFVLVRYSIEELFLPTFFGMRNYNEQTGLLFYFYDNIYYSFTTIFISTAFSFISLISRSEKDKLKLIEEKKNSELQALKTQINPHFIFNSLNNIYSLVYQKSDKALPAIEELSQLLRYSTKDLEKDYITIDKEITYIESLIGLEKLRIKNPEFITFEKNIKNPKSEISPMLLVPFVENTFKHGDFNKKGFDLKIDDSKGVLHFYLQNFKTDKQKDVTSGIGIENVRKRLEILYPKKHTLNIQESEIEFIVDLKISLAK